MATAGKKADADMLLGYTDSLRQKFFGNLDPNTEAFYAVPISNTGIAVGEGITQEMTNKGLFECADPTPPLSPPVYGAADPSYHQRVVKFLGAVSLGSRADRSTMYRLYQAKEESARATEDFITMQVKALQRYYKDEYGDSMEFRQWLSQAYPQYQSVERQIRAAYSAEASLRATVEGPEAQSLNRLKSSAFEAGDWSTSRPGLNMPVTDYEPDNQLARTSYRPAYSIVPNYAVAAQMWKNQVESGSTLGHNISYNLQTAQKTSWGANGFQNVSSGDETGCPPFFRVQWNDDMGDSQEETISAEELGPDLNVQLKATSMATFSVNRGQWDVPGMEETYKTLQMMSESTFPAVCKVTDLLMGYNITMEIQLSTEGKNRIQQLVSKVVDSGGEISFCGMTIKPGWKTARTLMQKMFNESGSSSIHVPSLDVSYPVLVGVKGKKLPEVNVVNA